jgi:hypothetical protein
MQKTSFPWRLGVLSEAGVRMGSGRDLQDGERKIGSHAKSQSTPRKKRIVLNHGITELGFRGEAKGHIRAIRAISG